ncbi:hypothetical protein [Streptomyces sp. NPDC006645]|uniref:hypothetical protein n=1 Tax=unclassified Streptomyces TaxID=2593676 RepID=UPI0033B9262D
MFPALRVSRPLRARRRTAGPERALWLAVLLLALLYTHGVNGHNAVAHASPLAAMTEVAEAASAASAASATETESVPEAAPTASTDFAGHDVAPAQHDGDEAEHGSESCASGQPPYRADLPARGTTPLGLAAPTRCQLPLSTVPSDAVAASATWRDPAILRV